MTAPDHAPSLGRSPEDEVAGRIGAVVLAGGTAARMGGVDKAAIELDGVTLLERALSATTTAAEVVVVGEQVPTTRPVTWTMEDPRGGGPAAGLLTALGRFLRPPHLVQVLAVDMPGASRGTFARLVDHLSAERDAAAYDGALLVDLDGRRQPLCAVYRRRSLLAAAPHDAKDWHGLPVRRLLEPLRLVEVPGRPEESRDVDTWADLRDIQQRRSKENRRPRLRGARGGGES